MSLIRAIAPEAFRLAKNPLFSGERPETHSSGLLQNAPKFEIFSRARVIFTHYFRFRRVKKAEGLS